MKVDFSGPYLKIERADQHIKSLEMLLGQYASENKERFNPEFQRRQREEGLTFTEGKPDRHIPTTLGDALHNLRASLDHAFCLLILANGHNTTPYSKFPFGKDWPSIKGSIDGYIGKLNGPSIQVRDFIGSEAQPFPGGKHNLFDLHHLDIADKHQCILPTLAKLDVKKMSLADASTGHAFMIIDTEEGDTMPDQFIISPGHQLQADEEDLESAFNVLFGEGQPLANQKIMPTIIELRNSVLKILKSLEALA